MDARPEDQPVRFGTEHFSCQVRNTNVSGGRNRRDVASRDRRSEKSSV
jgi:hypothetical protein